MLLSLSRLGSTAHFKLPAGQVSRAVTHSTVHEIWYVLKGRGQIWRSRHSKTAVASIKPGDCLTIPLHTRFQFRASRGVALEILGVTMPPWPNTPDEARIVQGKWKPTVTDTHTNRPSTRPTPRKRTSPGILKRTRATDRARRIETLLHQPAGKKAIDELPNGLLKAVTDASYLQILERHLDPATPRLAMLNAINAIALLADVEWDGRDIKSPTTSVPRLIALYEAVDDPTVRTAIIHALAKFGLPHIPLDFLIAALERDSVPVKAAILADMQFYIDSPYLRERVEGMLLPVLHKLTNHPQNDAVYADVFGSQHDLRFWIFRCLGVIGHPDSAPIIATFVAKHDWPKDVLSEAAQAHWRITKTPWSASDPGRAFKRPKGYSERQYLEQLRRSRPSHKRSVGR